jgi:hypothetical protein
VPSEARKPLCRDCENAEGICPHDGSICAPPWSFMSNGLIDNYMVKDRAWRILATGLTLTGAKDFIRHAEERKS